MHLERRAQVAKASFPGALGGQLRVWALGRWAEAGHVLLTRAFRYLGKNGAGSPHSVSTHSVQ